PTAACCGRTARRSRDCTRRARRSAGCSARTTRAGAGSPPGSCSAGGPVPLPGPNGPRRCHTGGMTVPLIVVGSVNMDLVFTEVERIPAPGETVSSGGFQVLPGGKGASQVAAAARLGAHTMLVGRVGGDDLGDRAME